MAIILFHNYCLCHADQHPYKLSGNEYLGKDLHSKLLHDLCYYIIFIPGV